MYLQGGTPYGSKSDLLFTQSRTSGEVNMVALTGLEPVTLPL